MLADYLVQFSPESALFEMPSNSANAFPAISSAVFVFPSSLASFSGSSKLTGMLLSPGNCR
jgi:hypothetical protein